VWDWVVIKEGASYGLLGLVVFSIIKGWLIPRAWHRERIKDYQEANALLRDTVREKDVQIGILLGSRSKETV